MTSMRDYNNTPGLVCQVLQPSSRTLEQMYGPDACEFGDRYFLSTTARRKGGPIVHCSSENLLEAICTVSMVAWYGYDSWTISARDTPPWTSSLAVGRSVCLARSILVMFHVSQFGHLKQLVDLILVDISREVFIGFQFNPISGLRIVICQTKSELMILLLLLPSSARGFSIECAHVGGGGTEC